MSPCMIELTRVYGGNTSPVSVNAANILYMHPSGSQTTRIVFIGGREEASILVRETREEVTALIRAEMGGGPRGTGSFA